MSYLTIEVEIDHGKVVAKVPSQLPEKASGLLTIFESDSPQSANLGRLAALDALQKLTQLDNKQADEWMAAVREARR